LFIELVVVLLHIMHVYIHKTFLSEPSETGKPRPTRHNPRGSIEIDARESDWCLRQGSKFIFTLVSPWALTFWPPELIVSCSCPVDHALVSVASTSVHVFKTSNTVFTITSLATCKRMSERTDWLTDWWRALALRSACLEYVCPRRRSL